jgi:DNA repair protein RadC
MTGARQALSNRVRKGTALTSPQRIRDYLMTRLATREFETFTLIYLDTRHRLIACEDLFRGTIDEASAHRKAEGLPAGYDDVIEDPDVD